MLPDPGGRNAITFGVDNSSCSSMYTDNKKNISF